MSKPLIISALFLFTIVACKNNEKKVTENEPSKKEIKIEEIKKVEITEEKVSNIVTPTGFLGIKIGEKIDTANSLISKETQVNGEGDFEGYKIVDKSGEKVGFIFPLVGDLSIVEMIEVYSTNYKTAKGIGVGSTFEDVKKAYPNSETHGSEVEGRTSVSSGSLYFYLETYNSSYKVDEATIKSNTKVRYINIR